MLTDVEESVLCSLAILTQGSERQLKIQEVMQHAGYSKRSVLRGIQSLKGRQLIQAERDCERGKVPLSFSLTQEGYELADRIFMAEGRPPIRIA